MVFEKLFGDSDREWGDLWSDAGEQARRDGGPESTGEPARGPAVTPGREDGLSLEEVQQGMNGISVLDRNEDGVLTREELEVLDTDGNGEISAEELRAGLGDEEVDVSEEVVTQINALLDLERFQGINIEQFTEGMVASMRAADTDGNGRVTEEELQAFAQAVAEDSLSGQQREMLQQATENMRTAIIMSEAEEVEPPAPGGEGRTTTVTRA